MSNRRMKPVVSADALLREHIAVLEQRQEGRRAHLREIEALIGLRDVEIMNYKAQLTRELAGTE